MPDEPQLPETPPGPPEIAPAAGHEYLSPAFMAAICAGVLTGVPVLNLLCCLWMIGGGALAVHFFRLIHGRPLVRLGDGARLGTITGFFGFFVAFFVNLFSQLLIHRGASGFLARFRESLERSLPSDPQQRAALEWAKTAGGTAIILALASILVFVVFVLCSTAGGALAAKGQRDRAGL
jgi:hypothetical protein